MQASKQASKQTNNRVAHVCQKRRRTQRPRDASDGKGASEICSRADSRPARGVKGVLAYYRAVGVGASVIRAIERSALKG
jgi:hypothetical protein